MKPRVRFRTATAADGPGVLRVHLSVLAEERWFVTGASEYPQTLLSLIERIGDFERSPNSQWLVAVDPDGQVLGFCTLTGGALARMRHVARFEVMVAEAHRGVGIGRELTHKALAWARANPMLHKVSLAVFDDNEPAQRLYRGLGFVEEGRRPLEYREPDGSLRGDVLMALDVGAPQGSTT